MMLLSRFWYVVLGLVAGAAVYVVFLAVGQYNRGNELVMKTGLASDSQTVEWAIKIDSRRRLDALLQGSVDPGIQASLGAANDKEKIPAKPRDDCKKALGLLLEKLPQDQKPDAIFAVDRDGRVVAEVGFDMAAAGIDDFELGGFPAVFDALHGYVRDDAWVLGSKLYLVFARPVEVESGQRPIGAVVAIREVNKKYVEDLAKRTRTNLAFYVVPQGKGQKIAYGTGTERFEESQLEPVATEAAKLGDDKSYENDGRSGVRMLRDDLGAMFARLPGDAWDLRAGFAVVRPRAMVSGPMGFLSGADDKDKANVNWFVVGGLVFLGALLGIALTFLEHTLPLRQLLAQADALKAGKADALALAKLRGAFRVAAQSINAGIERLAEKGGSGRKPADLESILGPVPAQPAMSAFAFGLKDSAPALPGARPGPAPGPPP
ncbi:MAG: CHASE4 domain-containing protein, partial [Myxococcales bacterium]